MSEGGSSAAGSARSAHFRRWCTKPGTLSSTRCRRYDDCAAGARRRIDRVLRWGRWLVLAWAIIGAAVTGTMVFRVADPWIALLMVAQFELSLAFVVLVTTLVLALFIQRPFCRYACPLGAVQSLPGKLSPIAVQRDAAACLGSNAETSATTQAGPRRARPQGRAARAPRLLQHRPTSRGR